MLRVTNRSKTYYKKVYKNFWRRRWIPGRKVEVWVDLLNMTRASQYITREFIDKALFKLELENLITEKQREEMHHMLNSPDKENHLFVLSIMEGLKPRAFSRRKDDKDGLPH